MKKLLIKLKCIGALCIPLAGISQSLPSNFVHLDTIPQYHTAFCNSVDGEVTRQELFTNINHPAENSIVRIIHPDASIDTLAHSLFDNPIYSLHRPELFYVDSSMLMRMDLKYFSVDSVVRLPKYYLFSGNMNDRFIFKKINGGTFEHDGNDGGLLYYEEMVMKLFTLDAGGSFKILLDLEKTNLPIREYADIDNITYTPFSSKILLVTSIDESGGRWGHQYFIFNVEDKTYQEFTDFRQLLKYPEQGSFHQAFLDISGKYLFFPYEETNDLGKTIKKTVLLFDSYFNYVQECLPRSMQIAGYNYEKGKAVSVNLHSKLDSKKSGWSDAYIEAVVSYGITVAIETALYQVYHNQELSLQQLQALDQAQLQLLKNMVFARHNYQFECPYYQAFFNLFDFYNTEAMRLSRTKDVNSRLTYNDAQNLQKISTALKRTNK